MLAAAVCRTIDGMDATDTPETFQLPLAAAERYEEAFVPALFAQWAPILCDAASVGPGQRVLDVACGTGIVARTAAERVGPEGVVVGVDLNEAMLEVARRVSPDLELRVGDAADLPFPARDFDAVLCQMALMFFPDRLRALTEMARVALDGGRVGLVLPSSLTTQCAFGPFVDVAARHAGPEAMALLGTYFTCGDLDELTGFVREAGLQPEEATTQNGIYRSPSIDAFVTTEVEGTPLVERISQEVYDRIRTDAHIALAPFTTPDGRVEAPFACHVVVARRPAR